MLDRLVALGTILFFTVPAYGLTGIVLDNHANGVAGATITVSANGDSVTIYSAANGVFSLENMPNGMQSEEVVSVKVWKTGYAVKQLSNVNPASNLTATLVEQSFTLSGRVIDDAGEPKANVLIDAGSLGTLSTDESGRFSVQAPYGTAYRLNGSLVDYYLGEPVTGILEGDTERVILALWD